MAGRLHIVFIMLDTFRADYLSDYGGGLGLRNLESLAKKSVVYKNAIAPGTYTAPSHLSIFLGKRALNAKNLAKSHKKEGVTATNYLAKGEITLARKLTYLGYKTSLLSSNAFLDASIDLTDGFSFVSGDIIKTSHRNYDIMSKLLYSGASRKLMLKAIGGMSHVLPERQLDSAFLAVKKVIGKHLNKEYGYYSLDRGAELLNKQVAAYLDAGGARARNFLFLNYMESHEGYPTQLVTDDYVEQDRWMYMSHIIGNEGVRLLKKACERRLQYLDRRLGELLRMLGKKGVLDHAKVIVASDHGQAFMEHDQMYHFVFPYQQLAQVPLLIADFEDGKQKSTRRVVKDNFSLTRLHDIILSSAYGTGEQPQAKEETVFCDHIGILNWWATRMFGQLRHRSASFERMYNTLHKFDTNVTAIYQGRHKLVHFYSKPQMDELYDLAKDPQESANIIAGNGAVVRKMLEANRRSLAGGASAGILHG